MDDRIYEVSIDGSIPKRAFLSVNVVPGVTMARWRDQARVVPSDPARACMAFAAGLTLKCVVGGSDPGNRPHSGSTVQIFALIAKNGAEISNREEKVV